MAKTILTKNQRTVLEIITSTPLVKNFYLAGGTALALQMGHRYSDDFDFFSKRMFQPETIISMLKHKGTIKIVHEDPRTLHLQLNNIKVSFFHYDHKLLSPLINQENNLLLASISDIAAMKIAAICNRGSKKDFVDLYIICNQYFSLQQVIELFDRKVEPVEYDYYHVVKSLQYFEDAEKEKMPKMIAKITWEDVKNFFEMETRNRNKMRNSTR